MYQIKVDDDKRLILVEIMGKMERDEVESFAKDMSDTLNRFPLKSMSLIVCKEKMDPLSQENASLIKNVTRECMQKAAKIAAVHKRTVTRMQLKRLEQEIKEDGFHGVAIARFSSRAEAFDYIRKEK